MHGLGPHNITVGGRATTVRQAMKETYSSIEEAKADISGLFALQYLVDAEADRPERRREERRVHRLLHRLRQDALVDEVLQREQAGDVGLGFLEVARGLLHRLADGRGAAVDGDAVRAEAVHQLVHQDVREEGVERDVALIGRREHDLRDRHEDLRELGVLHVLQHHALGALLLQHALVVRQIEGRGLHAAVRVARGEHDVDDRQRRKAGELRIAILRIDRQHVLDALQLAAEPRQLVRLDVVAKRDERLERRLVVEEFVLVDLVRSDGRLDRRP